MDRRENQLKSPSQVLARTDGMRDDLETEAYWDQLTDEDRRLIWLTATGKNVREIAADAAATPRDIARRYRVLIDGLGLDDRLSLVLAAVAGTARTPTVGRWIQAAQQTPYRV